ncbi:MBOAT family protein, partial [Aliarcobacter butzleri]|nr:MBOAT family protein [Aliarcobacter butzleri]
ITFNFINITWIFFRAKDFESAMKVLKGMFSLDNVVLTKKLIFVDIGAKFNDIIILFIVVLILVLGFKNSMYFNKYKFNIWALIFIIVSLNISFFMMEHSIISEFLYFNF